MLTKKEISNLRRCFITNVQDLLERFPTYYHDASKFTKLSKITDCIKTRLIQVILGEKISVSGYVLHVYLDESKESPELDHIEIGDAKDGANYTIIVTLVNRDLKKKLEWIKYIQSAGEEVVVQGTLRRNEDGVFYLDHALISGYDSRYAIYPQYRSIGPFISQSRTPSLVNRVLKEVVIKESLPHTILTKYNLPTLMDAYKGVHRPKSLEMLNQSTSRLKVTEFLNLLIFYQYLNPWRESRHLFDWRRSYVMKVDGPLLKSFLDENASLSMNHVWNEIKEGISSGIRMKRLINGGFDRSIDSILAATMISACESNLSALYLVHDESEVKIIGDRMKRLVGSRVSVSTDTNGKKPSIFVVCKDSLKEFKDLKQFGVVIADAKCEFGLMERIALYDSDIPHFFIRSMDYIPNTLSRVLYGDMREINISPPKIDTCLTTCSTMTVVNEEGFFKLIETQIDQNRQVLIMRSNQKNTNTLGKSSQSILSKHEKKLSKVSVAKMDQTNVSQVIHDKEVQIIETLNHVPSTLPFENVSLVVVNDADLISTRNLLKIRNQLVSNDFPTFLVLLASESAKSDQLMRLQKFCSLSSIDQLSQLDVTSGSFIGEYTTPEQCEFLSRHLKTAKPTDKEAFQTAESILQELVHIDPTLNEFPGLKESLFYLNRDFIKLHQTTLSSN